MRVVGRADATVSDKVFAFVTIKTIDIADLHILEADDAPAAVASAAPEPAALALSQSVDSSNPFLGRAISLVTKANVRYEGKLYTVASFMLHAHCPLFKSNLIPVSSPHFLYRSLMTRSLQ